MAFFFHTPFDNVFDDMLVPFDFSKGKDQDIVTAKDGKQWITPSSGFSRMDLRETANGYEIQTDLPGIAKDDINISVHENVLTIEGKREKKKEEKSDTYHFVERSYGSFRRKVNMPESADLENIAASYKDGVLHVDIKKKPRKVTEHKKITIQ